MESENNHVESGRFGPVGNYAMSFIRQVIDQLEGGMPVRELVLANNLKRGTVAVWIQKYGSTEYKNSLKRPSGPFKRSVARAIDNGTMTIAEARDLYKVSSKAIKQWLALYQQQENGDLQANNIPILDKRKSSPTKQPENEQIKALQQQLSDAQLKIAALNTLIDVAEEQLKINIRKKPGAKQS
jgi:transposase